MVALSPAYNRFSRSTISSHTQILHVARLGNPSRWSRLAGLVALTFLAGFMSMLFIATLYLQNVPGYSPFQAGVVFVPMGIVAVRG